MSDGPTSNEAKPATPEEVFARWVPWVLFVLVPLVVFPRAMIDAGMMDGGDDQISNLPLLLHSARKLLHGELLWTNDLWMGMPLLAEPEAAMFYPPRLLLLLFASPATAYAVYILGHFALAEGAAYGYLRALGLSRASATFGAVAYAFCGFMLGHIGHTMYVVAGAWSPLFLLFLHRAANSRGSPRANYLGAALTFAAVLFGGAVQLAVYLLSMSAILHLALAFFARSTRPLRVWTLAVVPALMLAALQVLPSMEYARGLTVDMRHDYAFSTALSWHPLLLPTLVMPFSPAGNAELYTRCGAMVLCAAAIAVAMRVRVDLHVRAWSVVALVAFLLMLGRFVPPLAHVLHVLPIVDVLRGPVRHNFEFGTAVAFLAAFGAEALVRSPPTRSTRVLVAVGAFAAVCALVLRLARRSADSAAAQIRYAPLGELTKVIVASLCAGLVFLVIVAFASRRASVRWLFGAMIALAVTESRVAESFQAESFWREIGRHPAPREIGLPVGEHARILPPHVDEASIDALPGDAVLYREGVQHLFGYSSIAPRDAASLFDLDMHGHARHRDDLIWSRLPSVFGVTHVIMPRVVCGAPSFTLDPATQRGPTCGQVGASAFSLTRDPRRCNVSLGEGRQRYRIDAELRSLAKRTRPVVFGIWPFNPYARGGYVLVPPAELSTTFRSFGGWVELPKHLSAGWLAAYTKDSVGADVRNLRLRTETLEVVTSLEAGAAVTTSGGVQLDDGHLDFAPDAGVAEAEKTVDWPSWMDWQSLPHQRLEVLARRAETSPPTSLVVDLYGGPSFDPETAQLVVPGATLGADDSAFTPFAADFVLGAAPSHVSLRAFATDPGAIEMQRARLLVGHLETLVGLHADEPLRGSEFDVSGDTAHLSAMGSASAVAYLPYRPITLAIDFADGAAPTAPVGLGLANGDGPYDDANERLITPDRVRLARRYTFTVALRADAVTANLRSYGGDGTPVPVRSIEAHDACRDRHYQPVREIEGGLWLYRNADALPRLFTVASLVRARDFAAAAAIVRDASSFDPRAAAVVESGADGELPSNLGLGRVTDGRIDGQHLEATVESANAPTFLVVNERWDGGWEATIDGAPARLFRANALVRGVIVPQGRHRVEMHYRAPRAVWVGVFLAILGVALALGVAPRLHASWVRG